MNNKLPVGVFDSGVGGLTVVREMVRQMPDEDILYFGDCLRAPYGSRSHGEILAFMQQILNFLCSRQVKMVVAACNTTTALGLEQARREFPLPIVGMNSGAHLALTHSQTVVVMATEATIASRRHENEIRKLSGQARVFNVPCRELVGLIEQPVLDRHKIERAVRGYLDPVDKEEAAVILGCTHYPLVQDVIEACLGRDCLVIDPASATVADAARELAGQGLQRGGGGPGSLELHFSADIDKAGRLVERIIPAGHPVIFHSTVL